jgi:Na+-translocating ferredoxin:NAD+ oxidoreductase RNF subunit RnfB
MLEIMQRIVQGQSSMEELELMEELAQVIKDSSLCGLGKTAPNPVLTTLKYFRSEYEAHIEQRRCPAGACRSLLTFSIDAEKCIGCTMCARNCPANCISGNSKEPHVIREDQCLHCGACLDTCRFNAVHAE